MKQLIAFFYLLITSLNLDAQVTNPVVTLSGCGLNYVSASCELQQRGQSTPLPPSSNIQPVTLNTSYTGTASNAYVFFTTIGDQSLNTIPFTFNGNNLIATLVGSSPLATCWEYLSFNGTASYFCSIPIAMIQNGNNIVSGLPTSSGSLGLVDTNGITLLVVYNEPCVDYRGTLCIQAGLQMHTVAGVTANHNLAIPAPGSVPSAANGFIIVGDAEVLNSVNHTCNGTALSFLGRVHNYVSAPITLTSSQTSIGFTSSKNHPDCTNLSVIGAYYKVQDNTCAGIFEANILPTNEICAGSCDGTIAVSPLGGASPYSISLSLNGTVVQVVSTSAAHDFGPLCPGNYTITITDSHGCTYTEPVLIAPGQLLPNITYQTTGVNCYLDCSGTITATINSPFETSYSYMLIDSDGNIADVGVGSSPFLFSNLCAGAYELTISTESGCSATVTILVASCTSCAGEYNPNPQTFPLADQSCYWSTGGNSNATVGVLNFLGTTDALPLVVKTNDQERMRVESNGNVGVHTNNPLYSLHNVGSATFSNTNTTTPYTNYNSTNYPVQIKTDSNQGLAILSNSNTSQYTPHQDRLHIYADDNNGAPVSVIESVESHIAFKERTIGQLNNRVSLGINKNNGQVVLKSDWLASGNPLPTPNAKLYIESNDIAFSGFPNPIGLFSRNISTFSSSGRSISVRGESSGIKTNNNTINLGGVFSGSNSYFSGGVQGISLGSYNGSVNHTNIGGWFQAGNGDINYAVFASATGTSGTTNEAGHFAGNVYATGVIQSSDGQLKQEVNDIENVMDIISHLRPVTYSFKREEFPQMNLPEGKHFGFISQEVMEVIPDIVVATAHPSEYNEDGEQTSEEIEYLALNYTEIIPFLTKAIQEQQAEIDELQQALSACCAEYGYGKSQMVSSEDGANEKPRLEQNAPNPFTQETTIRFFLPESSNDAMISVYALDGSHILDEKLNTTGVGQITISGNILSSGTYVYNLIVDGIQIDSKYMTLTK